MHPATSCIMHMHIHVQHSTCSYALYQTICACTYMCSIFIYQTLVKLVAFFSLPSEHDDEAKYETCCVSCGKSVLMMHTLDIYIGWLQKLSTCMLLPLRCLLAQTGLFHTSHLLYTPAAVTNYLRLHVDTKRHAIVTSAIACKRRSTSVLARTTPELEKLLLGLGNLRSEQCGWLIVTIC